MHLMSVCQKRGAVWLLGAEVRLADFDVELFYAFGILLFALEVWLLG